MDTIKDNEQCGGCGPCPDSCADATCSPAAKDLKALERADDKCKDPGKCCPDHPTCG